MEICPSCMQAVQPLAVDEALRRRVVNCSPTLAVAELVFALGVGESEARDWLYHLDSCDGALPLSREDRAVLHRIDVEFGAVPRPDHFTDHTHCLECEDHDLTLLARSREALRRKDLGSRGWDAVTFCSVEGVAYLMPALAKFALAPDSYADHAWYGAQLAWHLSYDGVKNRLFAWCSPTQREAVGKLVQHIVASRSAEIENAMCTDRFDEAIKVWSA